MFAPIYDSNSGPEAGPSSPTLVSAATDSPTLTSKPSNPEAPPPEASDNNNDNDSAPEEAPSTQPIPAPKRKQRRTKAKNAQRKERQRQRAQMGKKSEDDGEGLEEALSRGEELAKRLAVPEGVCVVCTVEKGKYKCPRCRLMTCSLACSKNHKENHSAEALAKPKPAPKMVYNPAAAKTPTDSSHPFSFLDNSELLAALFRQYPCLPDVLMRISDATQPPSSSLSLSSSNPLAAYGLSDAKRIENKLWDKSIGEKHGKEALRRARERSDEEGEAVRAYSELILHLMERKGEDGREVKKRKMREERELFEKLVKKSKA